ncbi:hypothetical protein L9F63_020705 [Diploptera punctata]|uniref:CRAL-TRIO domain-containing protein n=1 Tax=Diploptera punctata TaxID=6984 RepID=A0AAD7ZQZ4_DIPPU|nr:hypothetical protein L9F63_020705 [Diploptera punctata]
MKNKLKEILTDRNSEGQWFAETKDIIFYFPLPKLTDNLYRVTIGGLLHILLYLNTIQNYVLKLAHMVQEVRYFSEFSPFDVYILDMKDVTLFHILRYPVSILTAIRDFGLIAYRVQFKSGHFINSPVYLDILIAIVKLILKPKIFKRIHVHRNGVGNLYDFVPQSLLPNEYGGNAGPLRELWEQWIKKIEDNREWFRRQENMRTDECQRPKKEKKSFISLM